MKRVDVKWCAISIWLNVEHKDKELNFGADWKRNPLGCLKEVIKVYGVVKFKV